MDEAEPVDLDAFLKDYEASDDERKILDGADEDDLNWAADFLSCRADGECKCGEHTDPVDKEEEGESEDQRRRRAFRGFIAGPVLQKLRELLASPRIRQIPRVLVGRQRQYPSPYGYPPVPGYPSPYGYPPTPGRAPARRVTRFAQPLRRVARASADGTMQEFYIDSIVMDIQEDSIKVEDGVLKADCVATAAMVQDYDGVKVLKDPEELKLAVDFAKQIPCSHTHPPDGIVTSQDQIVGWTSPVTYDKDNKRVSCSVEIKDQGAIDAIQKDGKKDVSIGFFCDLDRTGGEFEGAKYDAVQRNIVLNHLAVGVDKGRCPSGTCGIGTDADPKPPAKPPEEDVDVSVHEKLLKEKTDAIKALSKKIVEGADTLKADELKALVSQMERISWDLSDATNVINTKNIGVDEQLLKDTKSVLEKAVKDHEITLEKPPADDDKKKEGEGDDPKKDGDKKKDDEPVKAPLLTDNECVKCGFILKSNQDSADLKCSYCSGKMRPLDTKVPDKPPEEDARMEYLLETEQNHTHTAMLDKDGNGSSTRDAGHKHEIKANVVQEANGHTHKLKKMKDARDEWQKKMDEEKVGTIDAIMDFNPPNPREFYVEKDHSELEDTLALLKSQADGEKIKISHSSGPTRAVDAAYEDLQKKVQKK